MTKDYEMKKQAFSLIAIIVLLVAATPCQARTVRQATKADVAGTTWKLTVGRNTVMAGHDVVVFTDSTFSHRFYWTDTGTSREFVSQRYDIVSGEMTLANGTRYLMTIDETDGHLTMSQEDCLPLDYQLISNDELRELEAKAPDDLTTLMNMTVNLLKGDSRTALNFLLQQAGTLGYYLKNTPRLTLSRAAKIRVCGPLNGDDISAIRELVADSTAQPSIKTLDLSRAWVISDSAIFQGYLNHMTHDYFAGLKGRRSLIELPADLAQELGVSRKVEQLQDAYGYAVELIPDSIYISYTATIADCVMKWMFAGMPYVERLMLPQSTRTVHYGAISYCPRLTEITVPQRLSELRADVLEGSGNVKIKTYATDTLGMTEAEQTRYEELLATMNRLRTQKREFQDQAGRETRAAGIKAARLRRDSTTMEMVKLLAVAIHKAPTGGTAARLLGRFYEEFPIGVIEVFMMTMDDAGAFSQYARPAWQYLKDMTSADDVDWKMYADASRMERVHVSTPGTLSQQKTEDEWGKVSRLYVSGQIDSTDIAYLSKMAGNRPQGGGGPRWGTLHAIDLSAAQLDYLPDRAFVGCRQLSYIRLPECMHTIGRSAFAMSAVKNVALPASLRRIRVSAFTGCRNLRSIDIPDSVVTIASGAFAGCRSLRDVRLSESLDTLGMNVFERCPSLKNLHLPASLRSIGVNNFLYSQEIEVTIDPANENFAVVEGQIVGKTERAKENLRQGGATKTAGKAPQQVAIPAKSIATYKIVNGKKVLVRRRAIK